MATVLLDQYAAAVLPAFTQRVQMATLSAAQNIWTESRDAVDDVARRALARSLVLSPGTYTPIFAMLLAAEGVDNSSTDAQISTMVSSVWNTVAG